MTIRIGVSPVLWFHDDLREFGGDTPLQACLKEAQRAGFEGVELGHKFPREPEALQRSLVPFGLSCVSGRYSAELLRRPPEVELVALRSHLDLLKAMGSNVLILAEASNAVHGQRAVPLARRPVLEGTEWTVFGSRLTALADATLREGVQLVYHHQMGTVVQSEQDIDMLMRSTGPSVHLLLDTGHATGAGADPALLARRYKERISHVHARDVRRAVMARATAEDWSFLDAVREGAFTVPGDGMVDFVATFRELAGYSGWVVIAAEQDPAKAHPLTYAAMGYANLSRCLQHAGLT